MSTVMHSTTDSARKTYDELGVLQLRGLITPGEIAEIRSAFMEQVQQDRTLGFDDHLSPDDVLRKYPRFVHPHRHPDTAMGRVARRLMLDRRLFDVVENLVGPALAAQSMFYFKPPTARGQALHQDNAFLQAHPETCVAAWIAVDDCDAENGALRVVPGSHRIQLLCLEPADETLSFTSGQVPVPDEVEIVQTTMQAGDVLFFHGSLVHGSHPNTSTDRFRRSLIFHYVPQASQEVSAFYDPLVTASGEEISIAAAAGGGACGEGWVGGPH
ncbi:phytanoyl-CoA dioxygenase family protein [Auraticoccus monumenti]|uniref:Ectoine hydroxylase-related dioxygenase, phytanoyl-CoA dioxygenase (PhyH) family n=1 Tax=Auraticoccus monumenti TaxID=675864 RepID=A0A1G6Z5Q4_9ACTN|nr:phytanoyl-CoA dioxygenase family protein [Auraticoccus monumenti]SDD97166.1 Ectoine hydroxylase-related dioxygenase, phytanoyl-CoA dioxygenase (PhyH) family [Auraticoccus monumenti]